MRSTGRVWGICAVLCACAGIAASAPSALAAFGIAKWEAGTCNGSEAQVKSCKYSSPPSEFYTQAAGHPPWGLTGFEVARNSGSGAPEGNPLKRIRVDVEPGLAANPQTLPACNRAEFKAKSCKPETQAGFVELEASAELPPPIGTQVLALKGKVFNLGQEPGLPLLFGIEVEGAPPLAESVQLLLEGHVSYAREPTLEARALPSGDFHEWFEIDNIPHEVNVEVAGVLPLTKAPLKTLKSKLFFNGRAGRGNFLTLPSVCGPASLSTSYLEIESDTGEIASAATVPPVGVDKCENVPFEPIAEVMPQNPAYDQPDGAIATVKAPQNEAAEEVNTADIAQAHAQLPEGLTLNPSAAHGLEACPPAKIHFESRAPAECPAASKLGAVTIETDLPTGSLAGSVYLGDPNGLPITGPPYTMYVVAESIYDVKVKVEGTAQPDPSTGRLTVAFKNSKEHPFNLPQLPFSVARLELNTGPRASLANPLTCATGKTESEFIGYAGEEILKQFKPAFPFTAAGCPSPIPFALSQSTQQSSPSAGAYTSYDFALSRSDGQQYVAKVQTTLPEGLVGAIPSVTLCGEPQAAQGSCPATSQIGTATVAAGAGPEPYAFSGPVYMTGPYDGAPYGLSIPVSALAGPFDLGTVVTRATVSVDLHTARVIASSSLPTIVGGVPLRLKSIDVKVNRSKFLFNPTNCGALATNTTLTSTLGSTQSLSTPFQASGCDTLPFNPTFTALTEGRTSRRNGASLTVKIGFPAVTQANIASVITQLPKQLVARLSTLNQACPEAMFNANPASCPAGSRVGTATARTPVLPGEMTGPATFVSHGGASFPDLDIVLQGSGVTVILVGHTNIANNITTSDFATVPDVPVSSFELRLPEGQSSALSANGKLCMPTVTTRKRVRLMRRFHGRRTPAFKRVHGRRVPLFKTIKRQRIVPLLMPTTITAQNGKVIQQQTKIAVSGCPLARHRTLHRKRRHRGKRHHSRRHK